MNGNPAKRVGPTLALLIFGAAAALTVLAVIVAYDHRWRGAEEGTATNDQVVWSKCEDGAVGWQCASLTVPIDYSKPNGATIEVALTRLPASDATRRIGPLLLNFGGPGGPAVSTLHESDFGRIVFSDEMRARFDLVGFDPRGIGGSSPLDCKIDLDAYYAVDVSPDSAAERAAQVDAGRRLAEGCARQGGALLPFMGTDDVVRDLERIRQALGVEPSGVVQRFHRLLKSAGLPDIRVHDLRHTAATLHLTKGTHPKVVQEMLGHSTIALTLDVYSHVMPGLHAEAAKKMDSLFSPMEAASSLQDQ